MRYFILFMVLACAGCVSAGDASMPTFGRPLQDIIIQGKAAARCPATVLVPLYMYPGPAWATVEHSRHLHPATAITAIINPANGPGPSRDPNYASGIAALQRAGAVALGYDHTSYARRSVKDVENDARLYHAWYRVNGVFFDEMASTSGHERYYQKVSAYAKSLGMRVTVGNPGNDTMMSYVGTVDSMVIYEGAGYPLLSLFGGWHRNFPKSTWGSISYSVPSLDSAKVCALAGVTGYIYITNDTLPNPYDTLPPYFDKLVGTL